MKAAIRYSRTIAAKTRPAFVGKVMKVAGIHKGNVKAAKATRRAISQRREGIYME